MIATQYSTASEATGCRYSTTVLRVLAIIECRHPVASLAVLYCVATQIEEFMLNRQVATYPLVAGK